MPYMADLRLMRKALMPTRIRCVELKEALRLQATLEVSGVSLGAWM
jgi:hypothetical protein